MDEKILGFSNRWYRAAAEAAVEHKVARRLTFRVVNAPYFLAMKLEAFHGRGAGDFALSHDLEDVVFVVDGRATIVEEVRATDARLRDYLRTQCGALLRRTTFIDALPGFLPPDTAGQARLDIVLGRLTAIAKG